MSRHKVRTRIFPVYSDVRHLLRILPGVPKAEFTGIISDISVREPITSGCIGLRALTLLTRQIASVLRRSSQSVFQAFVSSVLTVEANVTGPGPPRRFLCRRAAGKPGQRRAPLHPAPVGGRAGGARRDRRTAGGLDPERSGVRVPRLERGLVNPRLVGFEADRRRVLIVEAKFWAGLTENQPVAYLGQLPQAAPGKPLFVAPGREWRPSGRSSCDAAKTQTFRSACRERSGRSAGASRSASRRGSRWLAGAGCSSTCTKGSRSPAS